MNIHRGQDTDNSFDDKYEKTSPFVSVVIPVYNGVKNGFEACLESIINQTYKTKEIIVVDDSSVDLSIELAIRLLQNTESKILKHKTNLGLSQTWNDGITICKGEYILLIQQDCSLKDKTTLERSIERMLRTQEVFISGNQLIDISILNIYQKMLRVRLNEGSNAPLLKKLSSITENKCDLVQSSILKQIGLFETSLKNVGQDFLFSMKLKNMGIKITIAPELTYTILYNGEDSYKKLINKEYRYGKASLPVFIRWRLGKFLSKFLGKSDIGLSKIRSRVLNFLFPVFFFINLSLLFVFPNKYDIISSSVLFFLWLFNNIKVLVINNKENKGLKLPILTCSLIMITLDVSYALGLISGSMDLLKKN